MNPQDAFLPGDPRCVIAGDSRCVIAIVDIRGFGDYVRTHPGGDVLRLVDAFCRQVERAVSPAGGEVVKMCGDAALLVFAETPVSQSVNALRTLRSGGEALHLATGESVRVTVRAHYASVTCGFIGTRGMRDVAGVGVNELFCLPAGEFVLSDALQHALHEDTP
ncbi:MAG TPA: hypothetical protein PLE60_11925 [Candidatus Latescibacteria bacterium]|nr:hypothetical protein [Candidatus Latescibacterota bacterium]